MKLDGATLRDIEIVSYKTDDGEVLVDKVKFLLQDLPNGATEPQVTFRPRTQETITYEREGMEFTETNNVRYTALQFASEYEEFKEAKDAIEDGETVELSCSYDVYDQRDNPNDDGEDAYAHSATGIELTVV